MTESNKKDQDSFNNLRDTIIQAAVEHVPFTGWSHETLRQAASDSGIDVNTAALLFPNVGVDMALWFHTWCDAQFMQNPPATDDMKIREKITALVRARLELVAPHKEAIRQSLSLFAVPFHTGLGTRALWKTMDRIWVLAGDNSEDYNWYTKRATLSGVYTSILLHLLDDTSENHENTWAFLDRRIENVMQIEKCKATVRKNPVLKHAGLLTENLLGLIKPPKRSSNVDLPG